jgi:hypothetical protein
MAYRRIAPNVKRCGPNINPRATFDGYTPTPNGASRRSRTSAATPPGTTWWSRTSSPGPGVEAHEVEPWTENGQTWRVLSVTFPDSIDTHNQTQLYYFNDAGLLRRMDCQPSSTARSRSPTTSAARGPSTGSWCQPSGTSTPATKTGPRTCRGSGSRLTSATSGSADRHPSPRWKRPALPPRSRPGTTPSELNRLVTATVATRSPVSGSALVDEPSIGDFTIYRSKTRRNLTGPRPSHV